MNKLSVALCAGALGLASCKDVTESEGADTGGESGSGSDSGDGGTSGGGDDGTGSGDGGSGDGGGGTSDDGSGTGSSGTGSSGTGSTDTGTTGTGSSSGTGTTDTGSSSGTGTTGTGDTTSGTGTTGTGDTTTGDAACRSVDVVMSLDRTWGMPEEIAALTADPVLQILVNQLMNDVGTAGVDDFRLGIVDACPKPARYHNWGAASNNCNFPGNPAVNYLVSTQASPLDLGMVHCAAELEDLVDNGYNGQSDSCIDTGAFLDDNEQPAFTAAASLTEPDNTDFLRSDAILFIIALTNEDEEMLGLNPSTDPLLAPQDIVDMIVAAKGGSIDDVIFLGIAGDGDCSGPYGVADDAVNLKAVTQIFANAGRGLFWDICAGNLDEAMTQALAIVDTACDGG
jgi:hypothetical protein